MADTINELVMLRENLDRKREHLRAHEMMNAAGMTTEQRVSADIARTRAEAAWVEALRLYNAALEAAAREPVAVPKKRHEWCIGGCGDDGRCPHDPVCGN